MISYSTLFSSARVGSCHIEKEAGNSVGRPTFDGESQTTYSCVANDNCNYDVHVISNYEGNGQHGFGRIRTTGNTQVNIRSSGESSRPLILVFVSYEPVIWRLSIPNGVVIDRAILVSFQQLKFLVLPLPLTYRQQERMEKITLL